MNLIELIIDEENGVHGIEVISLVDEPAIEVNFIALKNHSEKLKAINEEKRIVMGAALIPNKAIYRRENENEYHIFFSKDTVRQASQLYLKNGLQGNSNIDHKGKLIDDVSLVESWIVDDPKMDKSTLYGFDLPVGSWVVAMKIDNDEVWNDFVKTGLVRGFSIEGNFVERIKAPEIDSDEEALAAVKKILENATEY